MPVIQNSEYVLFALGDNFKIPRQNNQCQNFLQAHKQTCHFDLTQNLNECEKKSEYTEKNLNLTTKVEFLYRNLYQNQSQKYLNLEPGYLNFTKFEKNLNDSDKIWMNGRSA